MKFATLKATGGLGVVDAQRGILDLKKAGAGLPGDMLSLINGGEAALKAVRKAVESAGSWQPYDAKALLAPIPQMRGRHSCALPTMAATPYAKLRTSAPFSSRPT